VGVAEILQQGTGQAIAIVAQHLKANGKHDAYAVWLYNSSTDNHLLGFVTPPVGSNGKFEAQQTLPSNTSHYKNLVVSLETSGSPTSPTQIVLEGPIQGIS
jgi:hypothetical protein